MVLILFAYF